MNCFEGSVFENICMAFTALGTVGATIVALYFSYRENRVKYLVQSDKKAKKIWLTRKIDFAYVIKIHNISLNRNIMLTENFSVKCSKKEEDSSFKLERIGLQEKYLLPHDIVPGETFIFLIRINQIEQILKKVNKEKITIYFFDKLNNKYKIKIKRRDLVEFVETDWNKVLETP